MSLQGSKPATAQAPLQPSGNGRASPAASAGAEELPASSAGENVTDLVSDDEAAEAAGEPAPAEAAQQASLSTLEKQAPGREDIAMADGEPAAIRCVSPACHMLHRVPNACTPFALLSIGKVTCTCPESG